METIAPALPENLENPSVPSPETPAPVPENAPPPPRNKGGRPKGSKNKAPRRRTRVAHEAGDPLAATPRDVEEAQARAEGVQVMEPEKPPEPPKAKLGPEKAAHWFAMICEGYNHLAPSGVAKIWGMKIQAAFTTDEKRMAVYLQCVELAKLTDTERAILAGPVVARLAEMEVSQDADLWFALFLVFFTKVQGINHLVKPAGSAETSTAAAA